MSLTIEYSLEDVYKFFNVKNYKSPIITAQLFGKIFYIKRDDLLFLGCSKQRGITYLMYRHLQDGRSRFVLSSSGNTALVAMYAALQVPDRIKHLIVFLDKKIPDNKLVRVFSRLRNYLSKDLFDSALARKDIEFNNIRVNFSSDPRLDAFKYSREFEFLNIRTSTDEYAVQGFKDLGRELYNQLRELNFSVDQVFIPSSSGATALGLFYGLEENGILPKINVVQTTKVYSLVKPLFRSVEEEDQHPASSIVDYLGHRRKEVLSMIQHTKGRGWIISSKETIESYEILKGMGIHTSYDSSLTLAAYLKADMPSNSLLLFTG